MYRNARHTFAEQRWLDVQRVRTSLAQRERVRVTMPRAAAILVAVIDDGTEPRLILTRRASSLRTHTGEVAFPGGMVADRDAGPVEAALRGSREELGLVPARVEVLGLLDDIARRTTSVTPVLARVASVPILFLSRAGVECVFEIPLSACRERDAWSIPYYVNRGGRDWPVFMFEWRGELIWGLTASVLIMVLEALGGAPFRLPPPYMR